MLVEIWLRAAFVAQGILTAVIRLTYQSQRGEHVEQAALRDSRVTLILNGLLLGLFTIAGGLWVLVPRWMTGSTLALPLWGRWAGAGLGLAANGLFAWTHHTLGRYWHGGFAGSLRVREQHQLIEHGPYKRVRHPMYTAMLGLVLGYALVSANWLVALPGLAWWLVLALLQVPREEAMLTEALGDPYRAYVARTGRYLPRLFG